MEKIYVEENKNKNQKRNNLNGSVVLSFAVAIFAVFSLAMAGISMNQGTGVSYAAPITDNSFTLKVDTVNDGQTTYEKTLIATNDTSTYEFPIYYANSISIANQVFCVERGKEVNPDSVYTKNLAIPGLENDPGLLYLLGLSKTNGVDITPYSDEIDGWVIQSAIWLYMHEKYPNDPNYAFHVDDDGNDDLAVLNTSGNIKIKIGRTGQYSSYDVTGKVRELANNAKSATSPRITVTKENDEITKTTDGKYYQSSLITVTGTPSSNLSSYNISIANIEGAIAVDENGNEISTSVPAGTRFYVRIPADKVTEKVQTLAINITGNFSGAELYFYTSPASPQTMVSMGPGTVVSGITIDVVGTPDTGMNTAQTIYFIGLIVLLCGVGIVYANAKPVQVKQ